MVVAQRWLGPPPCILGGCLLACPTGGAELHSLVRRCVCHSPASNSIPPPLWRSAWEHPCPSCSGRPASWQAFLPPPPLRGRSPSPRCQPAPTRPPNRTASPLGRVSCEPLSVMRARSLERYRSRCDTACLACSRTGAGYTEWPESNACTGAVCPGSFLGSQQDFPYSPACLQPRRWPPRPRRRPGCCGPAAPSWGSAASWRRQAARVQRSRGHAPPAAPSASCRVHAAGAARRAPLAASRREGCLLASMQSRVQCTAQ